MTASEPIQIKRYPNRRYYARNSSKYVSLQEIEEMIRGGESVEIRDSQSGEDLTRAVLAQILLERQPEKMALFPTDLLHFILRSNEVMSGFLRDYFRQSLTYLEYLQRHSAAATTLAPPMHWIRAWLDGITGRRGQGESAPEKAAVAEPPEAEPEEPGERSGPTPPDGDLDEKVRLLEERIRQLEAARGE